MTYNRNQARPLLTDAEYELFVSSLSDRVGELDRRELGKSITRMRKARDKYRDLAKRQNIGTRKRAGARGAAQTANVRTEKKATIFAEALVRLERQLDKVEAAEAREKRRQALERAGKADASTPGRRPSRPSPGTAKGSTKTFMSGGAEGANQAAIRAPQTRIAASRGAAGRRKQAKRDR
jgi:hypothetical protein